MAEYRYQLRGKVGISVAPRIRNELQVLVIASEAHLLVDCTDLTFIDSSGVALLLEANRDLEEQGRHMLLVNVSDIPRRVFETLGLTDLLHYYREPRTLTSDLVSPTEPGRH